MRRALVEGAAAVHPDVLPGNEIRAGAARTSAVWAYFFMIFSSSAAIFGFCNGTFFQEAAEPLCDRRVGEPGSRAQTAGGS